MNEIDLNDVQAEVVFSLDNKILLLAGAGSGKTHTLISRIIHLLRSHKAMGSQVLSLAFSNKACDEMRERICNSISEDEREGIFTMTFHRLGVYLLRLYGLRIGILPSFQIFTPDDSLDLLKSVYPDNTKRDLKNPLDAILEAKERGFDEKNYSRYKNYKEEYSSYFRSYESALRKTGNVDFADLINLSVNILKNNEDIRRELRKRWKYIFVDEYQDTNRMQFEFLCYLVDDSNNLFVVGDDDQSIYGFRGAEVEHILNYSKTFPSAKIYKLEQNYRSTKAILSLSNSLIKHNTSRYKKVLWTQNEDGALPVYITFYDSSDEASFIASAIEKINDYDSTAIIYRTNMQSSSFENELRMRRIPYIVYKGNSFFDKEEIKDILSYIRFTLNKRDVVSFVRIIAKPSRGIGKQSQTKIAEEVLKRGSDVFTVGEEILQASKAYTAFKTFKDMIKTAEDYLNSDNIKAFLDELLEKSGLIDYYKARDAQEGNALDDSRFFSLTSFKSTTVQSCKTKDELLSYLETISLSSSTDVIDKKAVVLASMHAVKGLEFNHVFVTGLEDELIPSDRGQTEEERRLFYVAMTRARKNLFLSSVKRRNRGLWQEMRPSRFITELDKDLYSYRDLSYIYTKNSTFKKKFDGEKIKVYKNEESSQAIKNNQKDVQNYLQSVSERRKKNDKVITKTDVKKTIYNIGDIIYNKKIQMDGKISNIRVIGAYTIVDVLYSDGRKSTLEEHSKDIEKKV